MLIYIFNAKQGLSVYFPLDLESLHEILVLFSFQRLDGLAMCISTLSQMKWCLGS